MNRMEKRKLGIDYGDSRVGIAITDGLGITVQGLKTIHHAGNDKKLLKELDEILKEYEVDTIVIGMPISMDGTLKARAETTKQFVHKLKCKYHMLKIEVIDERLTTIEANRTMQTLNIHKNRKKELVDTLAAEYILETYVNKNNR